MEFKEQRTIWHRFRTSLIDQLKGLSEVTSTFIRDIFFEL